MKSKIQTWAKQNPVSILCILAALSITCDTLLTFHLPNQLAKAVKSIGNDAFWILNVVQTLFVLACILFAMKRARHFLFNHTLGFYDAVAAVFLSQGIHCLRLYAESGSAWNRQGIWNFAWGWHGVGNLLLLGVIWMRGFVRQGDADHLRVFSERPLFQSGRF